jgi:hypothetical protein
MSFEQTFERVKKDLEFDYFFEKIQRYQLKSAAHQKMINILSYFIDLIEDGDYQDFYFANVNRLPTIDISSFVRLALREPKVCRILELIVNTCDRLIII